jgi:hypothetical protein
LTRVDHTNVSDHVLRKLRHRAEPAGRCGKGGAGVDRAHVPGVPGQLRVEAHGQGPYENRNILLHLGIAWARSDGALSQYVSLVTPGILFGYYLWGPGNLWDLWDAWKSLVAPGNPASENRVPGNLGSEVPDSEGLDSENLDPGIWVLRIWFGQSNWDTWDSLAIILWL